jgi:hypothetical protein
MPNVSNVQLQIAHNTLNRHRRLAERRRQHDVGFTQAEAARANSGQSPSLDRQQRALITSFNVTAAPGTLSEEQTKFSGGN